MIYIFPDYIRYDVIHLGEGYAKATLKNGEADLNPEDDNDKAIINRFGGVPKPEESKTATRKLPKMEEKEGD